MDLENLKVKIEGILERAKEFQDILTTNLESTKTSLVMPFFLYLGYDVFSLSEFIPEYKINYDNNGIGKVDYAIIKKNNPEIIIVCKNIGSDLKVFRPQMERYYMFSKAKCAILTDGIIYEFFCGSISKNNFEKTPFLTINLKDLKDNDFTFLSKISKENFDLDYLLERAVVDKYKLSIKENLLNLFKYPSDDFIKWLIENGANEKIDKILLENLIREVLKELCEEKIVENNNFIKNEKKINTINELDNSIDGYEILSTFKIIVEQIPNLDMRDIVIKNEGLVLKILFQNNLEKCICTIQKFRDIYILKIYNESILRVEFNDINLLLNYENEIMEAINKVL